MQTFDKKAYQREYMRRYRGSVPKAARDWLQSLRIAYREQLRADAAVTAYADAALLAGLPPETPAHLLDNAREAAARVDALTAEHPALAAEYFARHTADLLLRDARALRARLENLGPPPFRGRRPLADTPARVAALREQVAALRAARTEAFDALTAAQSGPLAPREATALQRRHEAARERHERAEAKLAGVLAAEANREARRAAHRAERDALLGNAVTLEEQAAAMLAGLPDPPRAPLHPPREGPSPTVRVRPLTDAALAGLSERFHVLHVEGVPGLYYRDTGRRVRSLHVQHDGARYLTAAVRDALDLV